MAHTTRPPVYMAGSHMYRPEKRPHTTRIGKLGVGMGAGKKRTETGNRCIVVSGPRGRSNGKEG